MSNTAVLAPPRAADDGEIRVISLADLHMMNQTLEVGDEIEVYDLYHEAIWYGKITELDERANLVLAREMFAFEADF